MLAARGGDLEMAKRIAVYRPQLHTKNQVII